MQRPELSEADPVRLVDRRPRSPGSASSRIATATTRRPARRAPPATRNGNRPFPAMRPRGAVSLIPRSDAAGVPAMALQDDAAGRRANEVHDASGPRRARPLGLEPLEGLRCVEAGSAAGGGRPARIAATLSGLKPRRCRPMPFTP